MPEKPINASIAPIAAPSPQAWAIGKCSKTSYGQERASRQMPGCFAFPVVSDGDWMHPMFDVRMRVAINSDS
jgi:hypothetical protein